MLVLGGKRHGPSLMAANDTCPEKCCIFYTDHNTKTKFIIDIGKFIQSCRNPWAGNSFNCLLKTTAEPSREDLFATRKRVTSGYVSVWRLTRTLPRIIETGAQIIFFS